MLAGEPITVFGDGKQTRDILFIDDLIDAYFAAWNAREKVSGQIYNIGGSRALPNVEVVQKILAALKKPESLMQTVQDRPGHDRRYALSTDKLTRETGWAPQVPFEQGLQATIDWYRANGAWVENVKSGEYQHYYDRNYGNRAVS